MSSSHRLLKLVRLIHLYLGVFISPMLLFFACTGFVQTFNLHETLKGREYTPPAILVKLGQFHKKQTLIVPVRKLAPAEKPKEGHGPDAAKAVKPSEALAPPAKTKYLWPMKIFFGLVALGLLTSTLSGIYMSYKYVRNRVLITGLLVAGVAAPIALTLF
jgi:uncharacterized iron-regulated membrane protein